MVAWRSPGMFLAFASFGSTYSYFSAQLRGRSRPRLGLQGLLVTPFIPLCFILNIPLTRYNDDCVWGYYHQSAVMWRFAIKAHIVSTYYTLYRLSSVLAWGQISPSMSLILSIKTHRRNIVIIAMIIYFKQNKCQLEYDILFKYISYRTINV